MLRALFEVKSSPLNQQKSKIVELKHVVKKLVSLEIAILAWKFANFDLRTKSWNIEKTAIKGKMIWSIRNPCFEDKRSIQQLVVNVCQDLICQPSQDASKLLLQLFLFTANTARMWWLVIGQKCHLWFLFMHQRSLCHNEICQRPIRFSTVIEFSIPTLNHVLIMVLNLALITETSTFIISPKSWLLFLGVKEG